MYKQKSQLFSIFIILGLIFIFPLTAHAKCSSPSAGHGGRDFQYYSSVSIENFCDDGDTWKMMSEVDDTGAGIKQLIQFGYDGGTCTAAKLGRIMYSSSSDLWQYCDGANWSSLGSASGLWITGAGDDIYYNAGAPKVGIGLTGPAYELDVDGSVQLTGQLIIGPTAGATTPSFFSLADLDDVDTTGVADGEVLMYSAGASGWVSGTASGGSTPGGSDTQIQFNDGGSALGGDAEFVWDKTGNKLTVTGDIDYTGVITDVSDRSLKENIAPLENSLESILALQGVSFTMKGDESGATELGLIAQEVEPVFPALVKTKDSGLKTLNYIGLIAPLVEAVKEQQETIGALKNENAALDARVKALETRYGTGTGTDDEEQ